MINDVLATAQRVSYQAATAQEDQIAMVERFLKEMVEVPPLQDPESIQCRDFVRQVTQLDERYINVGVPNAFGILTCNGIPLEKPIDVSDRLYIKNALTLNKFTSSGVQRDRATEALTINFAYPVHDEKTQRVIGAGVVVVSLEWWQTLLTRLQLPENSVALVLDGYGQVVAEFPHGDNSEMPEEFNTIVSSEDQVRRVYSKHKVFGLGSDVELTFVTGISIDSSLALVEGKHRSIFIAFTITVLLILLLFRLFFLNTILRPLNKLADLTFQLGRKEKLLPPSSTGVREMDFLQDRFVEMSDRKSQAESQIIKQTLTDALTGIANRTAFSQALSEHLYYADTKENRLAVILVDLDDFKEINDTLGHEAGDEVLRTLARRLQEASEHCRLISRPGGDEFMLLIEHFESNENQVAELCNSLLKLIKHPICLPHNEVVVSASIGIAHYPEDGHDVESLMSAADQAMYYAKECGRDTVRRFNWELRRTLMEKIEIIKDLRKAIENEEFFLLYQPIVNIAGQVVKFEALIRWQHPIKGMIPPDGFIPFAEQSRQIIDIGEWVIKKAQKGWEVLQQKYGEQIQVSVNVSPLQLSYLKTANTPNSASLLTAPVASSKRPGHNGLVIEITENLLMDLDDNTQKALLKFREQGIQVALDDFGTGYSSLAYIMNYDIDYLKIDKSFVQKLGVDLSADSLCEAIISMSHTLGIAVIAEGVETKSQATQLKNFGCDFLQGYLYSKPISLEEALKFQ
ncbi:bifunctional diguanylate cyclase/phosphodiesterase [Marinomonas dokdonensis]|uniref:bifunctional diguanylate cyclase/phosphodiesterase n=1 Tax=Marinomonas dokdonensis TaxID=328224 RepID=UPI0040555DE7